MRTVAALVAAGLLIAAGSAARGQPKPPPDEPASIYPAGVTITLRGHTVYAAPPGVEVTLTLELQNSSYGVRNVHAVLERSDSVRLIAGEAFFGDIPKDGSARGSFKMIVGLQGCEDSVRFLIEIAYDGGITRAKFIVPGACPGPRFALKDVRFQGGDGDGGPEPGETLAAFVILENQGRDAARNVRAHVSVSGPGVHSAGGTLLFPDIRPGRTESSSSPIFITIDRQRRSKTRAWSQS